MANPPPPPLIDNWDFRLIGQTNDPNVPKFKGYISSIDPTTAGPGVMIGGSQNTWKTLLGTIKVRSGLKRRGEANSAIAGVTSSCEWQTSLGATRVLRVTEENKLQVESNIADGSTLVFYDLMTGLDSTRFVFDPWWNDSLKKDWLLFVKFDAHIYRWSGGIGKLSSTGGTGPSSYTITLSADAVESGFDSGGDSILINGNTYVYTGVSGNDLTGVTSDPSGEPADSIVLSKVKTESPSELSAFSCDFIKVIGNQLNVGSYNAHLAYVSAQDDFTDFTIPAVRAPGDPDLLTLDSQLTGITVLKQSGSADAGNALFSGGLGDWYLIVRNQITVGTDLTEQVQVIKTQTSDLGSALAHEFIDVVGGTVVFLDQNNQLREFGFVRNIFDTVFPLLSLDVFNELKGRDFSGGQIRAISEEGDTTIHITSPIDGVDYMYQIREKIDQVGNLTQERLWQPPHVRGASRIGLINGTTYIYSNANPQMYEIWNTGQYYDDSPSDAQLPYESHAIFAYFSLADRTRTLYFNNIFFEGYMTQGTNLYCNVYQEYQGSQNIVTVTVNKAVIPGKSLARFYDATMAPSLGDVSLGEIPLGEGITQTGDNPPKFRTIRGANAVDIFEFALDVFSVDPNSNWQLLCLGANYQPTPRNPAQLFFTN